MGQLYYWPTIKNNLFAHQNEGQWSLTPGGNADYNGVYIKLWAGTVGPTGTNGLFLSGNAFLNENIQAFAAIYSTTTNVIRSDADYFGITNDADTASRYLDNSDDLSFNPVIVTNPATYVSDSQTPSFESPIKHNTDGTFEFLISPDYEAGARELTYTVQYSDGTNTQKQENITITIENVLD